MTNFTCRRTIVDNSDTKYYEESEHAGFQLFHLGMIFLATSGQGVELREMSKTITIN